MQVLTGTLLFRATKIKPILSTPTRFMALSAAVDEKACWLAAGDLVRAGGLFLIAPGRHILAARAWRLAASLGDVYHKFLLWLKCFQPFGSTPPATSAPLVRHSGIDLDGHLVLEQGE